MPSEASREALAQTTDAKERLECVVQAVGKFARLRREESGAELTCLARERWQAEQASAEAEGKTNRALFPIHAALIYQSFMGLRPETQAGMARVLERFAKKREKQESVAVLPDGVGLTQFEPIQGKSSHLASVDQTESDPIQPNPTKNSGIAPSPVEQAPAAMS